MNEADKEQIRWMARTQAGGHPSWEARAEQDIAAIEAAEAAAPKPEEPAPAPAPVHHAAEHHKKPVKK